MKKVYVILAIAALVLCTSCGNNKKQAAEAEGECVECADTTACECCKDTTACECCADTTACEAAATEQTAE